MLGLCCIVDGHNENCMVCNSCVENNHIDLCCVGDIAEMVMVEPFQAPSEVRQEPMAHVVAPLEVLQELWVSAPSELM